MFWAPLPANFPGERLGAPFGRWKDGICGCFSLGLFHPHLWCSLMCPQLQMAQVMTRMHLTCFGEPASPQKTKNSFYIVMYLVLVYVVFSSAVSLAEIPYALGGKVPLMITGTKTVGSVVFTLWFVYALCKTRQSVRTIYGIPGGNCEDFCCSLMCTCCTVAQLSRHMGDYDRYPGVCCTETGHPPSTPLAV